MTICTQNTRAANLGHKGVFRHARLGRFTDDFVHPLHNLCSAAHIGDFLLGFHRALPIDQTCAVHKFSIRQPLHQSRIGSSREIVIIHLNANALSQATMIMDQARKGFMRVFFGVLHIGVIIANHSVI